MLEAGLAAIPLVLDAGARAALDAHVRLLLAWNAAMNLTAIVEPEAVARLHVLDSLAAVPLLRQRDAAGGDQRGDRRGGLRIADIGSGAGFPGLALAAARSTDQVLLVDSVGKKVRFLEAAVEATGLAASGRVRARALRAEHLAADVGARREAPFDVVTARAVGALPDLVELAFPALAVGGVLLAWKRGEIADEVGTARRAAAALGRGAISTHAVGVPGLEGHRLVLVEKRGPTPPGYPRDPGRRARGRW